MRWSDEELLIDAQTAICERKQTTYDPAIMVRM